MFFCFVLNCYDYLLLSLPFVFGLFFGEMFFAFFGCCCCSHCFLDIVVVVFVLSSSSVICVRCPSSVVVWVCITLLGHQEFECSEAGFFSTIWLKTILAQSDLARALALRSASTGWLEALSSS